MVTASEIGISRSTKARVPLFSLHHTGRRSIRDDLHHPRPGTSRVPSLICSTLQTFANSVGMSEPIDTSISTLGAPAANLAACRSEKPTKFPYEHQRRQDSPMDLAGVANLHSTPASLTTLGLVGGELLAWTVDGGWY